MGGTGTSVTGEPTARSACGGWVEESAMTVSDGAGRPRAALRRALLPLALAQFICSFAGSNMNVMINDISKDLDTDRKSTRLNSSHPSISYAVFCLKKKKRVKRGPPPTEPP